MRLAEATMPAALCLVALGLPTIAIGGDNGPAVPRGEVKHEFVLDEAILRTPRELLLPRIFRGAFVAWLGAKRVPLLSPDAVRRMSCYYCRAERYLRCYLPRVIALAGAR